MYTVLPFEWPSRSRPYEDVLRADKEQSIFLIADGIMRSFGSEGYPDPSPAKQAADALLLGSYHELLDLSPSPKSLKMACRRGNMEVLRLNQQLGLWGNTDYYENDLAGAVFAGVLVGKDEFVWGFLTDCGVAHLSPAGDIVWITADRLTPVRQHYFPSEKLPEKEQRIIIRRDFRNKPAQGLDRTFGAFTGEEEALAYLEVGTRKFTAGDVLLVFTDGARPLVENPPFRSLLINASAAEIEHFVDLPEHCSHNNDKALIVIRTK